MGIFDALNVSEHAMSVHRFRSEIAAQNLSNVYTPGYKRKVVDLQEGNFGSALSNAASGGGSAQGPRVGALDSMHGAVRVAGVHTDMGTPQDERQQALRGVVDMYESKSAFELNMRAATMLKSMATSSLEIGRGG
jgi:flagellar basal body rod protein FlgC